MITAEISIPRSGLCISPVQSFFKELYRNLNYPLEIIYGLEPALLLALTISVKLSPEASHHFMVAE
ncbi:MAG: hypothetical protein HBSAPP04_00910 [Ignavibacteriaceae bacterium]|nr:MAG: hypothetical protein EDM75_10395 [Chlorobiota bacterium]GJQ31252.1 MAG: hypothetical protein HBSAPP04_00910 [Ignavibacteriaceae bacterium]